MNTSVFKNSIRGDHETWLTHSCTSIIRIPAHQRRYAANTSHPDSKTTSTIQPTGELDVDHTTLEDMACDQESDDMVHDFVDLEPPLRQPDPKPWPGALAEEYKAYPFEEWVSPGGDMTLNDPWFWDPRGDDLLRTHAVWAMRQLERKKWTLMIDTHKITERPNPAFWRAQRCFPGASSSDVDVAGVGNLAQRDALRERWARIVQEEIDAEEARIADGLSLVSSQVVRSQADQSLLSGL